MLWISSLPTASLFLLLLPCFPSQNGEENEQSPDIISVCEGDSITITCSMNDSENELGTYLTTVIQPINVLYVFKQNSNIHPSLHNRIEYSKEGRNLRITLNNVRESDSNIYLCTLYSIINGYHRRLNEKKTIVVVKANTSGLVEQTPLHVSAEQGQSISITCALNSSHEEKEIYLLKTHMQRESVLHLSSPNTSTVHPAFANRLEYSKQAKRVVITLHNVRRSDSDIYVCAWVVKDFPSLSVNGRGTMMLVKDETEQTYCRNAFSVIYGLVTVVVLLFSALIYCTLYHVNIKKYFKKRKPNAVYEDMSYSSRRNTLVRTNTYSIDN
ncbi:CD7 protein, partial [Todus mexicanus]|nr:CD7 protein [Todus mexicanus]